MDRRPIDAWLRTAKLNSAITPDDIGKALSQDGTTANQFKLAADGDVIVARLEHVEVDAAGDSAGYGTIALSFVDALPIVAGGGSVVVGGSVCGAGGGEVKNLVSNKALNYVVEIRGDYAIVVLK